MPSQARRGSLGAPQTAAERRRCAQAATAEGAAPDGQAAAHHEGQSGSVTPPVWRELLSQLSDEDMNRQRRRSDDELSPPIRLSAAAIVRDGRDGHSIPTESFDTSRTPSSLPASPVYSPRSWELPFAVRMILAREELQRLDLYFFELEEKRRVSRAEFIERLSLLPTEAAAAALAWRHAHPQDYPQLGREEEEAILRAREREEQLQRLRDKVNALDYEPIGCPAPENRSSGGSARAGRPKASQSALSSGPAGAGMSRWSLPYPPSNGGGVTSAGSSASTLRSVPGARPRRPADSAAVVTEGKDSVRRSVDFLVEAENRPAVDGPASRSAVAPGSAGDSPALQRWKAERTGTAESDATPDRSSVPLPSLPSPPSASRGRRVGGTTAHVVPSSEADRTTPRNSQEALAHLRAAAAATAPASAGRAPLAAPHAVVRAHSTNTSVNSLGSGVGGLDDELWHELLQLRDAVNGLDSRSESFAERAESLRAQYERKLAMLQELRAMRVTVNSIDARATEYEAIEDRLNNSSAITDGR